MPRDTTGVYTLPEAPFVANTLAQSGKVNSNNNDISAGLTDSLSRSGKGGMQADLPMGAHKVTGLANGAAATDAAAFGQVAGAMNNAGRNRIINGAFRINQRGQVSGVALAAGVYGHDRWKAGAGGCTYTFAAAGGVTITAGTLVQVIAGEDIEGGSYSVSWVGTAQGRVGAGAFAASPFTVAGIVAGADTTVEFNAGTLDRVQVEPGAAVSAYEWLKRSRELAACKYFFQKVSIYLVGPNGTTADNVEISANLAPEMRIAPALTSTGPVSLTTISLNNIEKRAIRVNGKYPSTGPLFVELDVSCNAEL